MNSRLRNIIFILFAVVITAFTLFPQQSLAQNVNDFLDSNGYTKYNVKDSQIDKASTAGQIDKISKQAGIYNITGEKYNPQAGSVMQMFGGQNGNYYVSDGKGMVLQYNLSSDGQFEHLSDGSQDDFLQYAWVIKANGDVERYEPKSSVRASNSNEEAFINTLTKAQGLSSTLSSIQKDSNLSYYQNASSPVQLLEQERDLAEQERKLKAEQAKYAAGTADYERIQKQIDDIRKQRANITSSRSSANQALAAAMERGATGSGLASCVALFNIVDWAVGNNGENTVLGCFAGITNFLIELFSFLLILAAATFDFVLQFTITDFASYFGKNGKLTEAVNTVWLLLKNLANLVFIGALIFIAFKTILDANGFNEKKTLGKVIGMAILINFSLLFTKLAIDMSNYVTVEIYTGIQKSVSNQDATSIKIANKAVSLTGAKIDTNLSAAFLNQMLITNVYGNGGKTVSSGNILTNGILAIIFILVATFVFAAAALMFLIRFLTLVILMMTSPLAFVGGLFPNAEKMSDPWWKALKDNCVFAPVYMLMTYISLQLLVFVKDSVHDTQGDWVQITVNYTLTIAAMIITLVVAKNAGGHAGAADWGISKARGMIGKSTFGVGGWAARGTLGKGAAAIANNKRLQGLALSGGVSGWVGKKLLNTADKGAKSSFDVRATDIGKKMSLGDAGGKDGYTGAVKEKAKYYEGVRKRYMEKSSAELEAEALLHRQQVATEEHHASLQDLADASDEETLVNRALETTQNSIQNLDTEISDHVSTEAARLQAEITRLQSLTPASLAPNATQAERDAVAAAPANIAAAQAQLANVNSAQYSQDMRGRRMQELEASQRELTTRMAEARRKMSKVSSIVIERQNDAQAATAVVEARNRKLRGTTLQQIADQGKIREEARTRLYIEQISSPSRIMGGLGDNQARAEELRKFIKDQYKSAADKARKKAAQEMLEQINAGNPPATPPPPAAGGTPPANP